MSDELFNPAKPWRGTKALHEKELAEALSADPSGGICGFCGGPNTFVDDCGFFGVMPLHYYESSEAEREKIKMLPCCEACFDGEPGKKHQGYFGVGDR
jgi:hypothetical protein